MHLYDFLFSGNGYKVRFLLRELGIPFAYRQVDILRGESRAPWFLAKNPFGQVPVLELSDGTCLRESSAILMHLAEGTRLLPDDRLLRTRVLEWLCFEQTHSIGDIACFAYTHCAEQGGFDMAPYPALAAWFARVKQQPGYLPIDQFPSDL